MVRKAETDAVDVVRAALEYSGRVGRPPEDPRLVESMNELRSRLRRTRSLGGRLAGITLSPHVLECGR